MGRTLVSLRAATLDDAPFLAELWAEVLRRADHAEHVADLQTIIADATASPEQRLVVAEYDGVPAGAVWLKVTTLTPLNLEASVQILAPRVVAAFRRHGIGRALMDAGVAFAEEQGVAHVATAVTSGSRDANRFMARLALGPHATIRTAPVLAVRSKLTAQRPPLATTPTGGRQLTRVLAARRSMRRSQTPAG